MRKVALLCAILCSGLLWANEQEGQEMCGESSKNLFDALKNCGQRLEQAADEFKGFLESLDSNATKDANETQSMHSR
ncbi:MAG: hypothetical protein K2N70_06465 [Helicobacter sp.]|nr:hypothetical protein [Helicobacter sp.]